MVCVQRVLWMYKENKGWVEMSLKDTATLEEAFKQDKKECRITWRQHWAAVINFDTMTQTSNLCTKPREVRRMAVLKDKK